MAHTERRDENTSLRYHIERVIQDMRERHFPPAYFMRALNWGETNDDELLDSCKTLLRNPQGQTAAFEYKRRFADGLTLEDVVIAHGAVLGFEPSDIETARRTLGE